MAKEKQTSSAWTLEDMPRLADDLEAMGKALENMRTFHDSYEARLVAAEKSLLTLDTGERMLPSEVIAGLSPGQIFQAALQAVTIGTIMANPQLFLHSTGEKARSQAAARILDAATTILTEACARIPGGKMKKSA